MSIMNTNLFTLETTTDINVKKILREVADTLTKEKYNAVEQIVGYLLTGEPIYITAKGDARHKMRGLERSKVLEILVADYLKWDI